MTLAQTDGRIGRLMYPQHRQLPLHDTEVLQLSSCPLGFGIGPCTRPCIKPAARVGKQAGETQAGLYFPFSTS